MIAQTSTKIEQAEALIVTMDSVQTELESASDYELFESCKAELAGLKSDLEMLGFQVERCVNGWRLIATQVVVEETSVAAMLHEDSEGLYASVPSSNGRTSYTVRVCARRLYSVSCDCAASQHSRDCCHRNTVDRAFDAVRPTFSEQCAGMSASQETIASLVATTDRYREPLKGSGVTGFRAAEVERKLAA